MGGVEEGGGRGRGGSEEEVRWVEGARRTILLLGRERGTQCMASPSRVSGKKGKLGE